MEPTIGAVIRHLETIAPPAYQEDYDNAGLIVGDIHAVVRGVLTCLDMTEAVLDEALEGGCNLVVVHHPIVFKGLKRLTGANYVERIVLKAIRNDIAIYAIHTNLDNMYFNGVNTRFAERLGLQNTRILVPQAAWQLVRVTLPATMAENFRNALADSGLGELLSILPAQDAQVLCEIRFDRAKQKSLEHWIQTQYAPSLQSATWQSALQPHPAIGAGMIGMLPQPLTEIQFLDLLKSAMHVSCVRHTALSNRMIQRVALCGGAGSFLRSFALAQGADAYITADFKYHEFFDADGKMLIADIGHYESEQFTINLLQEIISQKFSSFAVCCTKTSTNPVFYY